MRVPDVDRAVKLAAEHADHADRAGRLSDDIVTAITSSGLLRHFVPTAWGGTEGTFTTCVEPLLRLGLLGQVAQPGYYNVRADVPVSEVVMVAGGMFISERSERTDDTRSTTQPISASAASSRK